MDKYYLHELAGERFDVKPGAILREIDGIIVHKDNLCAGLEHEILDGCNLMDIDTKWGIDGVELIQKIRAMTPNSRRLLVKGVAGLWAKGSGWNYNEVDDIKY